MYDERITIDVDQLKSDMMSECMSAYFGGGFGAALVEAGDLDSMTPEQIVSIAQSQGIDLRNYIV